MCAVTTVIGQRGQVTIHRAVRRRLGIQAGDQIAFLLTGDHVVLHPLLKTLLDVRGSVAVERPQDYSEIRRQAIEAHARRVAQDEA